MVASVPLLTIRTFSIDGIQRQINSAISTSSGFGIPKLKPRVGSVAHRIDNDFRRMTENRRSPAADVIDVFISIDIPNFRAGGACDEKWLAIHIAKCADRRIDAAGNAFLRATKNSEEREVTRKTITLKRQRPSVQCRIVALIDTLPCAR